MAEITNSGSRSSRSPARPGLSHLGQSKKLAWPAALIVAAIVVAIGVYAYLNSGPNKYKYTYKTLTATRIDITSLAGNGGSIASISLQKPPELTVAPGPITAQMRTYQHHFKGQLVASLSVQTNSFTGSLAKVVEPIFAAALKRAPSSRDYQSVVAPLTGYTQSRLPSGYQISLGTAQAFNNSHVKSGAAWQFDVTASAKSNPKPYQKWQGELLYIWTSSHVYYVLLDSIQQNWQANQSVWQQVVDSLKFS